MAGIALPKLFPYNSAILWERNGTHWDKRMSHLSPNPHIFDDIVMKHGHGWLLVWRTPSPPLCLDYACENTGLGLSSLNRSPMALVL
jgi:hypothetical protein